jgi:hypothetical protein
VLKVLLVLKVQREPHLKVLKVHKVLKEPKVLKEIKVKRVKPH